MRILPILFESTLTNDKIALKYTILFLFMDVGLKWYYDQIFTPCFFECITKNSMKE